MDPRREDLQARNDAMRAQVETMLTDYRQQRQALADVQEQLSRLRVRRSSPDGVVTVTVGPRGVLEGLQLSTFAYRQVDPATLAERILETAQAAADEVSRLQQELLAPLVPDDLTDPSTGLPDVSRLLPEDPGSFLR